MDPHYHLSRRTFLRGTAAAALGAAAGATARAAGPATRRGADPLYRVVLLGDLHYDRPEHHDMAFVRAEHPRDEQQIRGYIDASARHTPALLEQVRRVVATSSVPVPFVLHVGDLVEGLCGSFDLATRQFRDATGLVERAGLGAPFLMCKGNHDVTGPGAARAYQSVLLPWLGGQAGAPLDQAAFTRRQGDDLFVFFDGYQPDLGWLAAELADHADARHTFFVVHQPVVPYNARADWTVYPRDRDGADRARLLELLGRRRATVIGGHLHKYAVVERSTQAGPLVQLAVCSVVRGDRPRPQEVRDGVAAYGDALLDLEPDFAPPTRDRRKALLDGERPHVRRFEYADLPGYAVLNVWADALSCDVYAGVDRDPWRSPSLDPTTRP
jgi:hypothetical protein